MGAPEQIVVWEPRSRPQAAFIACPVFEIFYGGSRGSLKTDGALGDWISHAAAYGEHAIGLMVRRERTQLVETYERAKAIYTPLGFKFNDSQHVCVSPDGARLRFAYLEHDADAESYQGHSYTRVYVEELGNFPNPGPVMKLMATLRSANGVPCGFRATGNPGGPGHQWVKARYIDPAPKGWKVLPTEFKNPFTGETVVKERIFIPGKITDHNLLGNDYVANLQMSGSPELVRAWLEGDWNVIAGAYFPEFSMAQHVVEPRELPAHWLRFRACDWGSAHPFSVGWYAVSEGDLPQFPRGALIKYREWYGMQDGQPNVGLRLTAEEVAQGIVERDDVIEGKRYEFKYPFSVIDPAAFQENGGPSIAERMHRCTEKRVVWREADNKRVSARGAMGGWDQLRSRLVGSAQRNEDGTIDWNTGRPMLYFFSTCTHTIRTLPAMQHDATRAEDIDSDGEDHAPDETRYACMSRPYLRKQPVPEQPTEELLLAASIRAQTMGSLMKTHLEKRRRARQETL